MSCNGPAISPGRGRTFSMPSTPFSITPEGERRFYRLRSAR